MEPIGIFDSGYGGLTILKDIQEELPEYDYLYLGDNARAPYGPRSFDVVYEYTLQAVQELFDRGCHLVILACNTASAKALRTIQQKDLAQLDPNKRVLGVIRPSTELLGELTTSGSVGILATEGTVRSESYVIELQKYSPQTKVSQQACPLWVPLIENDEYDSEAGHAFIQHDVEELMSKDENIDTILLGCTHFPILREYIQSILPEHIQIIEQGKIVAKSLRKYLERHPEIERNFTKNKNLQFLTTENATSFAEYASTFMNREIHVDHIGL